ncbi:MAG: peptide chain release factor N(5)-glutamine methyltransferase [Gammaproteobacteria bacterium]|nr:peptide chain release factor N(5)-glutamine methyltransferase [Gammaproteobacteria bacterium]
MTTPHPQSYSAWLEAATARLVAAGVDDSPRLDAEILLTAALDKPRSHLVAWPEKILDDDTLRQAGRWLARRETGEPVAHILGRREFWSLPLEVNSATLIPRPDTETLIEAALELFGDRPPARITDLGTGSGAIALALKSEFPEADVIATDASEAALEVARRNADTLGLSVEFRKGSWWEPLAAERYDLVVSNPPYIRADDPHLEQGDVRFEPRSALTAGTDGLDDIRSIIAGCRHHLDEGGWLLLEHGHDQGAAVRELLSREGLQDVSTWRDVGGNERISGARRG